MKHNYLSQLLAIFCTFIGSISAIAQNDYAVSPIPFQVYTATSTVQGTLDDAFTPAIALGFDFNYFGNNYSEVYVSTNGYISFTAETGGYSPWNITAPFPNPTLGVNNSILGSYHDLNNSNAEGTITYSLVGTAPYRRFVVIFNNQSHFSCTVLKSTFQIVIYETLNIIDVQVVDKPVCAAWNGGNAALGITNINGTVAVMAPGRNTGPWTAYHEGWRFQRPTDTNIYNYTACDDNTDGVAIFNLNAIASALNPSNPSAVVIYNTAQDANDQTNPITVSNYSSGLSGAETLYANVDGVFFKQVLLRVVDCSQDYDLDNVATVDEDLNGNGNLADDDTDGDGIPNFMDNEDDGDLVLTSVENVFGRSTESSNVLPDTDADGIPNYLDNDDDGDGTLTINEDYNGNNDPSDDDTNNNGIPDYLDQTVLRVETNIISDNLVKIFPNPTSNILNVQNNTAIGISTLYIYSVSGRLIKHIETPGATSSIDVSDLNTGLYFLKVNMGDQISNFKFIKK